MQDAEFRLLSDRLSQIDGSPRLPRQSVETHLVKQPSRKTQIYSRVGGEMQNRDEDTDEFSLDMVRLREEYFASHAGSLAGVVSRKIWMAVVRHGQTALKPEQEDIHQDTYAAVFGNFAKIVGRFAASGRQPTRSNFEAWLATCIRNVVIDMRRRRPPQATAIDDLGEIELPTHPSDPALQMRMHLLFEAACQSLTPNQREAVERRLVDREKPAALAERFGLTTNQVYKLLYEAKLKLRNELVRLIAEDKLARQPHLRARYSGLIGHRCSLGHPCHFYRHPCPLASADSVRYAADSSCQADDPEQLAEEAATLVAELLDEWNLPPLLDRCYWAATEGWGKTGPSRVTSDNETRAQR